MVFHITVFLAFFFGSCRNDKGPLDTQRSVNSLQETLLNSSFSYGSLSSKYNFKYIYIYSQASSCCSNRGSKDIE